MTGVGVPASFERYSSENPEYRSNDMVISSPTAEELTDVLHLAFAHLPERELLARIDAMLIRFGLGVIPLDGVFQAKENGRLNGAFFSQSRSDGTTVLWPPVAPDQETYREFFAVFERYCLQKAVKIAVMLVDLQQQVDAEKLEEHGGFTFQSDLISLVCETEKVVLPAYDPMLEFVSMTTADGPEFANMAELVHETYRNSRDFPGLVGVTPTNEVLRGYQRETVFHPELWFFIRWGDEDVGTLLLADQSDGQMELIYMGLLEPYRNRGFAKEIIIKALETAKRWNRPLLLTSVDERNAAAVRAYLKQGFVAWDRKKVFARFFQCIQSRRVS